ncbi:DUF7620 family protein [Actinacidiphila alni]|uniref:DUF7620 family protein n=1 Tax=Actinacidiphila alni TaxID=380248 RepID=UPI0034519544
MGWIDRLLHRRRGESAGQVEAREALARAREAREQVARTAPEVAAVAARLRELRTQNHFAELFEAAFRGGGGR